MNFKNLIPSFILVAIYFIADEFFGTGIGLLCAIILGLAEFIHTRIKEKRNDRLILLITLFFCIPGIITLMAKGSFLEQLQPVIIEAAICTLLGIFAYSKADISETLPASVRKNINITDEQQKVMKRTMKVLFFILSAHTMLYLAVILSNGEDTESFLGTPLLYILIGLFFITVFIRNKILLQRSQNEEWLPIVDEKGEVTGKAPRSLCHSGSKLLHPVIHLHITNNKREIFLQKRSMKKKLLPGMWDTAVGGHIGLNEKIEDALKRETFEELGITDFEAKFIGSYLWESSSEKELVFSFICTRHNEIRIDNDEVDEGRFWSFKEIENNTANNLFTPNFLHEYRNLLKNKLKV